MRFSFENNRATLTYIQIFYIIEEKIPISVPHYLGNRCICL